VALSNKALEIRLMEENLIVNVRLNADKIGERVNPVFHFFNSLRTTKTHSIDLLFCSFCVSILRAFNKRVRMQGSRLN
jgi:hypothetical protein